MKRTAIEIKVDILKLTTQPSLKTRIVYLCNLNFVLAEKHLSSLMSKGLIEKLDQHYTTTDKGLIALRSAQRSLFLFDTQNTLVT